MKCKYCGMYLENVDEESPNGMAHTIKCQTKRIHELENEKNSDGDKLVKFEATGWQIYKEPKEEPKLPKEQKIDSGEKEYTCLVCGKKMSGLDGMAEVRIKRISISSLYESTLSHYCDKCFLKIGFDETEKELRNRQQPQPAKEPKPEPQYKVGDWVELNVYNNHQGQIKKMFPAGMGELCGTRIHRTEPTFLITGLSGEFHYDTIARKLSPSEVVIHIGCLSGTVAPVSTNGIHLCFRLIGVDDKTIATIRISCLDPATRSLVESLLKAQEEEK